MKPRISRRVSATSFGLGFAVFLWMSLCGLSVAQQTAPPAASPQANASTSQPEVSSHDEATTFKVNVRLVVVRVVVRDAEGHAIGTLHKEDFALFDDHKPQAITQFSVEQPGNQIAREQRTNQNSVGETGGTLPAKAPDVPERFVAYVFDDLHMKFEEIARIRDAAEHHFATLRQTDRAAILTVSGQGNLDFTDDRAQLHAALLKIQPRPRLGSATHPCPFMSHYIADLIVNKNDPQVLQAVTNDAFACTFNENPHAPGISPQMVANQFAAARNIAQSTAMSALNVGNEESRLALNSLKDVIRRLSVVPGERSVVLVSPGFLSSDVQYDVAEVIEHALHANVVIGTLDARGLYVPMPGGDASGENAPNLVAAPEEAQYEIASEAANDDVLSALADATAGVFFHNNNDLADGLRQTSSSPEYYYVLGFAPQNLKFDGRFHGLKVTLKNSSKLTLQARKGYYAPKQAPDAAQEAKQEIEDALFSQEEMHDLPVQLHTQFFKSSDTGAKLAVLAHVDVKHLRFRKADGRNNNDLTIASGLFDRNGIFISGMEKVVTMHLKDDTLEHRVESGVTVKTSFDVKPGSYLVRLVVRDAEGQLSAENGAVEIP